MKQKTRLWTFTISDELLDRIKKAAEANSLPVAAFIRLACVRYIEELEKK